MAFPSRRSVALTAVIAGSLMLNACSVTTPAASPSSTPSATISSQALLDKATTTVLDQLLTYPSATQAQVSSSIITLPPGVQTGLHKHEAPMYAYILEGELTVTYDGGIVKTYHPGEAVMEAEGTAHNGKNNGTVPVRVLVVNMGAAGVANTVSF